LSCTIQVINVWRDSTFQQVAAPTFSLVLPCQVAFGSKTVLEPTHGGDVTLI